MTGTVDASGRALLPIRLKHPLTAVETVIEAWVDTGFTGDLVIPLNMVVSMVLPTGSTVRVGLADGNEVELNTFECLLEWFGTWKLIEVIANQGQFPLLGVGLLLDRELKINFLTGTLTLD